MGRPLFSSTHYAPVPDVRVEAEHEAPAPLDPQEPAYELWNSSNPFDPDSEEFFANEVYEAIIDPTAPVPGDRGPSPILDEISSSSSSEAGDSSGRSTPILVPVRPERSDIMVAERDNQTDIVVVRRVNEESQERLERDLNQGGTTIPVTVNRTVQPPPPSTPPSYNNSLYNVSPSPVVGSTPRLYTWHTSASPTRVSPMNNSAQANVFMMQRRRLAV